MPIFEERERDDLDHPAARDTRYSYLDRSGRPEAARVRAFLEGCLAKYPEEGRAGLVARLRGDDEGHQAAVFELLVHELLLRAGHTVIAIEPRLAHTRRSPDFLAQSPRGDRYYLECAVSTGRSELQAAGRKRLDDALEAAGSVPSPHHHIDARVDGLPGSPVPARRLRSELAAWIAALPKGEAARRVSPLRFVHDGMTLQFQTLTSRRSPQTAPGRLSSTSYAIEMKGPGRDLRSRIMGKANRYGELDHPYVVAVANSDPAGKEEDVLDALMGSPIAVISTSSEGVFAARGARAADGVWNESGRARKRGLSAVLSFDRISAWKPNAAGARLIRNPWASRPLPDVQIPVDELNPDNGEFVRRSGPASRTWFGLDDAWPQADQG